MKAIIIEDEKKNITQLKALLNKYCKQVLLIGEAASADEGARMIAEHKPDLIFLDIRMPHKSGFDMLAELGQYEFEVIFVTGYNQYGIQAVKCSALDYLLKPVKATDLVKAVAKAELKSRKKQTQEQIANLLTVINDSRKADHRIALPLMKEIRFVNPNEITRCEAANSYTRFYWSSGETLLVSKGLFEYEEMLQAYGFIRCHQSHLVNRKYILSLRKEDTVNELQLAGGLRIPVSRLRIETVREALIKNK